MQIDKEWENRFYRILEEGQNYFSSEVLSNLAATGKLIKSGWDAFNTNASFANNLAHDMASGMISSTDKDLQDKYSYVQSAGWYFPCSRIFFGKSFLLNPNF